MKVHLQKSTSIPEGEHKGVIHEVSYRMEPYQYADLHLTVDDLKKGDDTPLTIKYGMPISDSISDKTTLGKFLMKFGFNLEDDIEIDDLKGREVLFTTEEDAKGFAQVTTIRPKK